jgi:hypothetical protein
MEPRKKMSLQDLKDLFPGGMMLGGATVGRATQKGFKHVHNPAAKPSRGELTPAQWHRQQRAKRNAASKNKEK